MNLPAWLEIETDHLASKRLSGGITRQEAVTALRDLIIGKDDRPLTLGIISEYAGKLLDSYHRTRQHAAPLLPMQLVQAELFPALEPRMPIRPGVTKPVIDFTAHDWDTARAVIVNRTEHAIKGAEHDRDRFLEAFAEVRPLLEDGKTTADVAPLLLELRRTRRLRNAL